MTDPHHDEAIEVSLRRQFSPPSLDALADRIAAEAARMQAEEPPALSLPPPRERAPRWPIALAVVVAAAAVLLLLRPRPAPPPAPSVAEAPPPAFEMPPPSRSERAGRQLHEFLTRGDTLPSPSAGVPQEVCETDGAHPHLSNAAKGVVEQLGECGGTTDTRCETFDLPADRALLVQLDSGERVIVCIERPWTDPAPELPVHSDLHRFRSELGDYVIYEVTPLDHSVATKFLQL